MDRRVSVRPGYDCRRQCSHDPKGEHGISSEEWWFAVVSGRTALSLSVLSGSYPESVDVSRLSEGLTKCQGCAWALHRADPDGNPCEYVVGGLCKSNVSYLIAESFWREHGDPCAGQNQPEAFWQAFEAMLRKAIGS